ncbi:ferredoxin reductase [Pseudonocardia oceani]|uniref:ferredoxin reductase n=1 Tax=Pseudonocardia oceani TaxID=2792013 RepID=UPI001C49CCCE|nr:ferredoxin reductase [Pseudonocardia oceani]
MPTEARLPRGARRLRAAAAWFTTPLLPDDYLTLISPLWSARELRGRIVEVVPEAGDAATLVIEPGWGWPFDSAPGQYIGIAVEVDGRFHWRSYSLTSPPTRRQRHVAVTVKAMPEGFLSQHLVSGVAPGTVVRLAAPRGEFVLPDPPPPRILFLTAGSGLTPVMAMLRTLARRRTLPDVVLVHSAPDAGEVLFGGEIDRLSAEHPGLRVHEQHTRRDGRLDLAALDTVCADWREREAWVCGPNAMLDEAERVWGDAGLARRLHVERFSADLTGGEAEGGTVTFGASGREVEVDGATTLLEAGESAGVALPFGCRTGICHSCTVPLRSGAVRDLRDGTEHRIGRGAPAEKVQTCVTAAAGDCVLDA